MLQFFYFSVYNFNNINLVCLVFHGYDYILFIISIEKYYYFIN